MAVLRVKMLRTLAEKSMGLIGAAPVYPVFFTTRWGIHTFGVLLPIDILILDNNNRVVTLCRGLAPNRVFFWNPKYKNVIELPAGSIKKNKISVGSIMHTSANYPPLEHSICLPRQAAR